MGNRLPVLESLRIASPCSESWDRMAGGDRVRNCASCKLDVFNLSAMTRADAEALLASRTGRVCARYYRRGDGTILTADCPVGVRRRRRQVIAIAAIGGAASLAAIAGVARQLQPPPAEAPGTRIELVETVTDISVRGAQPEPQRVLRARGLRIEPAAPAPDPDRGHWLMGDIDVSHDEFGEPDGSKTR